MTDKLSRLITNPHERDQIVRYLNGDRLRGVEPTRWWIEKICVDANTAELYARELLAERAIAGQERAEENAATAEWQADARRAFREIETLAARSSGISVAAAARLRDALGERFSTPEVTP